MKIAAIGGACDTLEARIREQMRELETLGGMVADDFFLVRVEQAREEADSVDRYAILAGLNQDLSNQLATLVLSLYERPAAFVEA
ncbi:hypothetical protein [Niveibacterium umoris]|uniref:Uncharacterized protein n=1 Tax=Niveibacterium umoris TaxID=1193620 RepID=A0A840BEU1_9RHOO|nr:hypothetical protein [Niveibacterium umoris]MBB4012041.1 hypothetical protein [Niveibacterium umoris]